MIPARQQFSDHVFTDAEPHPTEPMTLATDHRQVLEHRHDDRQPAARSRAAGAATCGPSASASASGLGFPGEAKGILEAGRGVAGHRAYTVAYGQGVAVTAVQLAAAMNTIANGGTYVSPRLVRATIGRDGKERAGAGAGEPPGAVAAGGRRDEPDPA